MRLNPQALALSLAAVSGGFVLLVGCFNLSSPLFGAGFLSVLQSLCPGYKQAQTFESVLTATGYSIMYGAIIGWVAAWLYNRTAK